MVVRKPQRIRTVSKSRKRDRFIANRDTNQMSQEVARKGVAKPKTEAGKGMGIARTKIYTNKTKQNMAHICKIRYTNSESSQVDREQVQVWQLNGIHLTYLKQENR